MSDAVTRLAVELRKLRLCEQGEVPCPFCRWDNNPDTEEMGCIWMAEQLLASGAVPDPIDWRALLARCIRGALEDGRELPGMGTGTQAESAAFRALVDEVCEAVYGPGWRERQGKRLDEIFGQIPANARLPLYYRDLKDEPKPDGYIKAGDTLVPVTVERKPTLDEAFAAVQTLANKTDEFDSIEAALEKLREAVRGEVSGQIADALRELEERD